MFVYDENKNPFIWNLLLSFNKMKLLFSNAAKKVTTNSARYFR